MATATAPKFGSRTNRVLLWVAEWGQHCMGCDECARFNSVLESDAEPCPQGRLIYQRLAKIVGWA